MVKEAEASTSLSVCELELVSITSPECSPVASIPPDSLAFALFATVKVPSSTITPSSFCATGSSFTPVTVIVKVAVSVSVPSEIVYVKTSVTVSPASKTFAAFWSAIYV